MKSLVGMRFGRLVVLSRAPNRGHHLRYVCRCDCGVEKEIGASELRSASGPTRSCGCLRVEAGKARATHGMRKSPEYACWKAMRERCSKPKSAGYRNYGGRGISVCDRWERSFEAFFADMGPKPSPDHTLDRIDNDGNYEPGNCRWATRSEQSKNCRRPKRMPRLSDGTFAPGIPRPLEATEARC